jgi:gamma-glutamyl:cysteine ligase YbdK (ATP-grasp superfamily)
VTAGASQVSSENRSPDLGVALTTGEPEDAANEPLALWEGVGVEIEYAIVDAATLDVRPVADLLLAAAAGEPGAADVERGRIAWSNELSQHVLELKTNGPAAGFAGLAEDFQTNVREASEHLERLGARLLPGGMHPWMDPARELRIWPHEYNEVYRTFDRIFGCRGHGWANLQSTHVNLPFRGDEEFHRLHEAVRLVLPLIPALTASSPVLDGRLGPALDNRLLAYRDNARLVPSVTGQVVPERVRSRAEYRREILARVYADLAPLDPEGTLRNEWVNARGAIARFQRGSIEIRVIDAQECVRADVAVAAAVTGAVRYLAEGVLREPRAGTAVEQDMLTDVLERAIYQGERGRVEHAEYSALLGVDGTDSPTLREVWEHLAQVGASVDPSASEWDQALQVILSEGPLARRIRSALEDGSSAGEPTRDRLAAVYRRLADCVSAGVMFRAAEV